MGGKLELLFGRPHRWLHWITKNTRARVPKSNQIWNAQFLLGHPLFAPFEALARGLRGDSFPSCEALTALSEQERLRRAPSASPLEFVPAVKKSRRAKRTQLVLDELYDGSIHLRGQVPCLHHSYHDLFNALAFSAYVRSKRALHARQFNALKAWAGDAPKLPGRRTREQDALTIFDEGGVVVLLEPGMMRTWRTSDQPLSLSAHQPKSGALPLLFGHALVEHLFDGHTQIRASALVIELAEPLSTIPDILDAADVELAARINDPAQFLEPGADAIFFMDPDRVSLGVPKPSWAAWNPGDREAFSSRYRPIVDADCPAP